MPWNTTRTVIPAATLLMAMVIMPVAMVPNATSSETCREGMNDLLALYPEEMEPFGDTKTNVDIYWNWTPELGTLSDIDEAADNVVDTCTVDNWDSSHCVQDDCTKEECQQYANIPLKCAKARSESWVWKNNDCEGFNSGWECWWHASRGSCKSSYDVGACILKAETPDGSGEFWRVEDDDYELLDEKKYDREEYDMPLETWGGVCSRVYTKANGPTHTPEADPSSCAYL